MNSYHVNKPFLIRIVAVISAFAFGLLIAKFLFSSETYRCVTSNSMKYVKQMGDVKAYYNTLWEEYRTRYHGHDGSGAWNGLQNPHPDVIMKRLKIERDILSQQMNMMWKMVGRIQCEWSGDVTSGEGGWCQKASSEDSGHHMTDPGLVRALSSLLKSKSVGSFGDGPGAYKREILKLGEVKSFDSYDGAPFSEETSSGRVHFLDLTLPQFNIPIYDFILSLEVAEHIPGQYESTYLDNLVRHARMGIILSWAIPGQGGLSHVNSKPLHYVVSRMKHFGFHLHEKSSKTLQKACTVDWLKRNVFVYVRGNYTDFSEDSKQLTWFS